MCFHFFIFVNHERPTIISLDGFHCDSKIFSYDFLMDCVFTQPYFESIVLLVNILLKPYVSQYNCYNFEIHEYDD